MADLPVVDHEVKFAVGRAIEFKNGTRPELHDFAQHHLPFGEPHGYRHLKFQDASGPGYRTRFFGRWVRYGYRGSGQNADVLRKRIDRGLRLREDGIDFLWRKHRGWLPKQFSYS